MNSVFWILLQFLLCEAQSYDDAATLASAEKTTTNKSAENRQQYREWSKEESKDYNLAGGLDTRKSTEVGKNYGKNYDEEAPTTTASAPKSESVELSYADWSKSSELKTSTAYPTQRPPTTFNRPRSRPPQENRQPIAKSQPSRGLQKVEDGYGSTPPTFVKKSKLGSPSQSKQSYQPYQSVPRPSGQTYHQSNPPRQPYQSVPRPSGQSYHQPKQQQPQEHEYQSLRQIQVVPSGYDDESSAQTPEQQQEGRAETNGKHWWAKVEDGTPRQGYYNWATVSRRRGPQQQDAQNYQQQDAQNYQQLPINEKSYSRGNQRRQRPSGYGEQKSEYHEQSPQHGRRKFDYGEQKPQSVQQYRLPGYGEARAQQQQQYKPTGYEIQKSGYGEQKPQFAQRGMQRPQHGRQNYQRLPITAQPYNSASQGIQKSGYGEQKPQSVQQYRSRGYGEQRPQQQNEQLPISGQSPQHGRQNYQQSFQQQDRQSYQQQRPAGYGEQRVEQYRSPGHRRIIDYGALVLPEQWKPNNYQSKSNSYQTTISAQAPRKSNNAYGDEPIQPLQE